LFLPAWLGLHKW